MTTDNINDRLALLENALSEISEGNYTEEIREELKTWKEYADNFINIIPSRDVSFKTKSRLDKILGRLELTDQDRRDLEKYINFGGGETLQYIKESLEIFLKYKDKVLNIIQDAPEEFDTLIEIFDFIEQHIKESNIKFEEINNNVLQINKNSPFEKGNVENSAVLKGEYEGYSNKAISQTSVAVGAGTIAGLKGWYYSAINFTNNQITLSDKQPYVLLNNLVGGRWSSSTPNIKVGDKVSIVNNSKYDYCGEVKSISGNVITLKESLPFSELSLSLVSVNNPDDWTVYIPDRADVGIIDLGGGAFAEGALTKSTNIASHAEGIQTHAYGQYSHAEGFKTIAGYAAHAEGRETTASGHMSHAEGQSTLAIGSKSHAEGTQTETHANNSHAEGYKSIVKDGAGAHAEGYGSVIDFTESTNSSDIPSNANKEQSIGAHVEGVNNTAAGIAVHVEGKNNKANRIAAHAEGVNTRAGVFEVSNENTTSTEGLFTHAEGNSTLARGSASHAEGAATQALGRASHAEGRHSVANGNYSHAEGFDTFAGDNGGNLLPSITNTTKGYFTHAEGHNTLAEGNSSHAEGKMTVAIGIASHTEGFCTETNNEAEHAEGKFNVSNSGSTIHSVGIGTSDTDRKNAHEITNDGKHYIIGIGDYDGTNPTSTNDLVTYIKSLENRIKELENIIEQITIKVE